MKAFQLEDNPNRLNSMRNRFKRTKKANLEEVVQKGAFDDLYLDIFMDMMS